MKFRKIVNLLDATSDGTDLLRFVTKNRFKLTINEEKNVMLRKKL